MSPGTGLYFQQLDLSLLAIDLVDDACKIIILARFTTS